MITVHHAPQPPKRGATKDWAVTNKTGCLVSIERFETRDEANDRAAEMAGVKL